MDPKEDLELLLARVEQMRQHQRDYFASRMQTDKKLAMAKENEVDELCRRLRARGFNPDRYKNITDQTKLF